MSLIPPLNFGMVESGLYRSGEPSELNYPFLESLNLVSIIYLAPDNPSESLRSFVSEQNIELIHLGKEGTKTPWKPTSEDVVISALTWMLDDRNYPCHVMCQLGRHRTGTVIGCLRKLQKWNLASIFAEYRRYAGIKVRLFNEQFIELFDEDLVNVPEHSAIARTYRSKHHTLHNDDKNQSVTTTT